jgi:hypothetical protein
MFVKHCHVAGSVGFKVLQLIEPTSPLHSLVYTLRYRPQIGGDICHVVNTLGGLCDSTCASEDSERIRMYGSFQMVLTDEYNQ